METVLYALPPVPLRTKGGEPELDLDNNEALSLRLPARHHLPKREFRCARVAGGVELDAGFELDMDNAYHVFNEMPARGRLQAEAFSRVGSGGTTMACKEILHKGDGQDPGAEIKCEHCRTKLCKHGMPEDLSAVLALTTRGMPAAPPCSLTPSSTPPERSVDSSDAENPGNNLYVTGLSARVTDRDLEKHFSAEGERCA